MAQGSERPVASVLQDIVGNVQEIIRSEVRLAKTEVKEEAAKTGMAAGILGAGVVFAAYAFAFVLLGIVHLLATVVASWIAAIIVAMVVAVIAAILITAGLKRIKDVHPTPDRAIESMKENVKWAKNQTK